jgi:hypothetical protein
LEKALGARGRDVLSSSSLELFWPIWAQTNNQSCQRAAAAYFIAAQSRCSLTLCSGAAVCYTLRFYALDVLNYFMQLSLFYIAKRM